MIDKSKLFKNAWFYFKKGWYNKSFSNCLHNAWVKAKNEFGFRFILSEATKRETEKAVLISTEYSDFWIPKSALNYFANGVVSIKSWFTDKMPEVERYQLRFVHGITI